jgi:hypothetical protein
MVDGLYGMVNLLIISVGSACQCQEVVSFFLVLILVINFIFLLFSYGLESLRFSFFLFSFFFLFFKPLWGGRVSWLEGVTWFSSSNNEDGTERYTL